VIELNLRTIIHLSAIVGLLGTVVLAGCATPRVDTPAYEVYAIRYGTILGYPTEELIPDADASRRSDLAMTIWLLRGPGRRNVLVDAGFYRDEFMQEYHPQDYRRPSQAIDALGLAPDDITDIIISHIHWDHLDGVDLFPKARVWIQRAEYEYYVGPKGETLHDGISAVDAIMLADLRAKGRVELVDGDTREIIPGITVYTGGRHTFASEYAGVRTRIGTVIIASDNVYLYENLDRHVPIGTTFDAKSNIAAQDRMLDLAAGRRYVIPGHDMAVFERFPKAGNSVVRID
jgi:glyoxylase-like metal-dependent hydrolase (beta-lactamase superfamily II)